MKVSLRERLKSQMNRAGSSSSRTPGRRSAGGPRYKLSEDDASVIKAMLDRGDPQHDIASYYGVNGGRIGDIATGKKFRNIPISRGHLPPRGPYHVPELRTRLLTANRRRAATRDDIINACALIENRLEPDEIKRLAPVLSQLLRSAEKLDRNF